MKNSEDNRKPFYRIELNGTKVGFDFDIAHKLKKDILNFFDDNIGEIDDFLMPTEVYKMEYWKYISINFDEEWAESERYKKLIEDGCLTLLFGVSCEILYEPVSDIQKNWQGTAIATILDYINNYIPADDKGTKAKTFLIETFNYAENLDWDKVDKDQVLIGSTKQIVGKWFSENIVKDYYKRIFHNEIEKEK